MKLIASLAGVILLAACFSTSCKKKNDPCGLGDDGYYMNEYLFWTKKDLGNLTVDVTNSAGEEIANLYDEIKLYYPAGAPSSEACFTVDLFQNAVFSLEPGKKYTYRAYSTHSGNVEITGEIPVTCEQNACLLIELK